MKESVQIKAVLFEGRHDALLGFYSRYSRLFVNKLLLKLCEGIMPNFKPSLALFDQHPENAHEKGRKVSILIEKKSSPLMYAFYCDLPYGSRTMVIVNLMNSYVQLAEADARLMERLYWDSFNPATQASEASTDPSSVTLPKPSTNPVPAASEQGGDQRDEIVSSSVPDSIGADAGTEPQADPLSTFDTGL